MTVRDATTAKGGRNQLPKMPVGHMSNSKCPQRCDADHIQVSWETPEGAGAAKVTLLRQGELPGLDQRCSSPDAQVTCQPNSPSGAAPQPPKPPHRENRSALLQPANGATQTPSWSQGKLCIRWCNSIYLSFKYCHQPGG